MKATNQASQKHNLPQTASMPEHDSMPMSRKENMQTGGFLKVATPIFGLKVSEETMQSLKAQRLAKH